MKILVPFKSVTDPYAITVSGVSDPGAEWVVNPFDEIAIEEALRLRERGEATEVVCITIGPSRVDEQVRTALAMGTDRAVRIDDAQTLDPYAVARLLKAAVERESPDVVIMGKQAVDDDSNQVGQMLAGLLEWPQATFVSKIEFTGEKERAQCTRETDAGLEVISVKLPAIITADLRLNEPRYVSIPAMLKAFHKPVETFSCNELDASVEPMTTVLDTASSPQRSPGTRVDSVEDLIAKLRQKEKVL